MLRFTFIWKKKTSVKCNRSHLTYDQSVNPGKRSHELNQNSQNWSSQCGTVSCSLHKQGSHALEAVCTALSRLHLIFTGRATKEFVSLCVGRWLWKIEYYMCSRIQYYCVVVASITLISYEHEWYFKLYFFPSMIIYILWWNNSVLIEEIFSRMTLVPVLMRMKSI